MTPERWRVVGDLFAQALAEPEATRARWLAAAGAPDDVRLEVAALLDAHRNSSPFLDALPAPAAGTPAGARDLRPGDTVGPYRLTRVLGAGGMGVVFEAEDLRLHRKVALKAVASVRAADAGDQQRLRQEARAAAALVHPNIATVYALEEIDGHVYISSELLDGETLRVVLARGPLSRSEALEVALALASALETAHAGGIIHRDLKPENVLRLPDGRVKVLDFGLARFEGDARRLASVSRLTVTGLVAGTPGYMAPEQLLGLEIDGRTDQFALGVLLAELAAGVNPYDAPTLAATIARVLGSDGLPSPRGGRPLPPDLEDIANRCTRQRPDDRYPSIRAARGAIEACLHGGAHAAGAPRVAPLPPARTGPLAAISTRSPLWWWRFHQAAAAGVYWLMIGPAWWVHRELRSGPAWFLACLVATIVAANVRLHLRFSAAVLPAELPAQRAKTRYWVALADWSVIALWGYAGTQLVGQDGSWAAVFVAFAIGVALVVGLIEPATTRAAFPSSPRPE